MTPDTPGLKEAGVTGQSPEPAPSRCRWTWLVLVLIVLFTAGVRFRLRDMPLERDEGEYAYAGQLILQGIPPYALAYNMKFPGTYVAYALIMSVFGQTPAGIHLGYILVNAAGIILVFFLSARLVGDGAALAASAIYACLSLSQGLLGMAAHATHFVIVPALGGLLLLLKQHPPNISPSITRRKEAQTSSGEMSEPPHVGCYKKLTSPVGLLRCFCSGTLLGVALLMKQPGAFFALFAIGWLIWIQPRPIVPRRLAQSIGALVLGLITPIAITGIWLWHSGVFDKFWFWTIDYAREYASEYPGLKFMLHRLFNRTPGLIDAVICVAVPGLIVLWRKADRSIAVFVTGWFAFSSAAIFPGFNFWPHYYILCLPAAALLAGTAITFASEFFGRHRRFVLAMLPGMALAALLVGEVIRERALFFQATPIEACRLIYGWNPFPESMQIGKYIDEHADKNAGIAVFGSEPEIYFFSHRHSATGYIYTYGLMESQPYAERMQREMMDEIQTAKPEYVIWVEIATSWAIRPDANPMIFDWAQQYVNTGYQRVGVLDIYAGKRTDIRWDAEAQKLPPQSVTYLSIFKRSD